MTIQDDTPLVCGGKHLTGRVLVYEDPRQRPGSGQGVDRSLYMRDVSVSFPVPIGWSHIGPNSATSPGHE